MAVFLWFKLLWGCYRYTYTVYSYTYNTEDSGPNLCELPQLQRVYSDLTTGLKDPESARRIPVAHSLKKNLQSCQSSRLWRRECFAHVQCVHLCRIYIVRMGCQEKQPWTEQHLYFVVGCLGDEWIATQHHQP